MITKPIKTRIFKEGENLITFITEHIRSLKNESIVIVTSKIVALSEGRTAALIDDHSKERLIRSESEIALPTKYVWLTVKDGMVMASAGIDESNADGKLILLPKDSYKSAKAIRKVLMRRYGLKKLGIVITDSRTLPLRAGVMGLATGYAGFRGIRSYIGKKDIFGRKFKFSRTDVADSLATSAVFVMGEGNEQIPLAVIEGAPVEFCDRVNKKELHIDLEDDIYLPFFSKLPKSKFKKSKRS